MNANTQDSAFPPPPNQAGSSNIPTESCVKAPLSCVPALGTATARAGTTRPELAVHETDKPRNKDSQAERIHAKDTHGDTYYTARQLGTTVRTIHACIQELRAAHFPGFVSGQASHFNPFSAANTATRDLRATRFCTPHAKSYKTA